MNKIKLIILILLVFPSCKKSWLDAKRDISLVVPTTLSDMRQLVGNSDVFAHDYITMAEISTNDANVSFETYQNFFITEMNAYIWNQNTFNGVSYVPEWDESYKQVLYANVALEGLSKIKPTLSEEEEWKDVKGAALFLRARAFYNLALLFTKPFDSNTAGQDLGIPLRLTSDIHAKTTRSTVRQTYDRIITDLKNSIPLLRTSSPYITYPTRPAAYGLLARCFLNMRMYSEASKYSDSCLQLYSNLTDYNIIDSSKTYPFPRFVNEIIFYGQMGNASYLFMQPTGIIDSSLFLSYDASDNRRALYFIQNTDGTYSYRGSYVGISNLFTGIATDEIYLIRSECYARAGMLQQAANDLNTLLLTRYKKGTFNPFHFLNKDSAIATILLERRKELLMRGIRWQDLRRLNKESQHHITLKRMLNGEVYELVPNSPRYVFPIPDYIISSTGIEQNEK